MAKGIANFSAQELQLVLSYYDIGKIDSTTQLKAGNKKAPKKIIKCGDKKYLLKRRPHGKDDPFRVAFAHTIQKILIAENFPIAKIIPNKQNETAFAFSGHIYELFEYVQGSRFRPSPQATFNAGRTLAQFHKLTSDYPSPLKPVATIYHDSENIRGFFQNISQAHNLQLDKVAKELSSHYNLAARNVNNLGFHDWTQQILHGDWHPGNILLAEQQVVAVLDFDSIKIAPAPCDLANAMLHFSIVAGKPNPCDWPDFLNIESLKHFLKGYLSYQPISKKQLLALPSLMIETMIAEALMPIATTGLFEKHSGKDFLEMIHRKCNWIEDNQQMLTDEMLSVME